ncbi:hypothetical protein MMC07_000095 [Pseudocyphellaria aurata]|nr:hypothetical protein [Pseudocyphellaria aurata]
MNVLRQCIRTLAPIPNLGRCCPPKSSCRRLPQRTIHISTPLAEVKPFLLPDIGEGIKEVQIIQWFVEPEARVEQFDKLCEVQSDKAAAEITSRFDGVVKKLHYGAEDMALVGKPLCDIDVQNDSAIEESSTPVQVAQASSPSSPHQPQKTVNQHQQDGLDKSTIDALAKSQPASLATPAVRGLLKELKVDIANVSGTGKDGRVMKDDVYRYVKLRDASTGSARSDSSSEEREQQVETRLKLSPIQSQMFKTMTRSLSIPHFLYTDEINISPISAIRQRLNHQFTSQRLSYLPFIMKAVSLALGEFPLLNSRVEVGDEKDPPQLIRREKHNLGIAMDTPLGLVVPNIKNISCLSIIEIASEISRLQILAKAGKLSISDLTGGTFTVSNIGSIGGTYVAPVIVQSEVAILGVGKVRTVPAFDEQDRVVKREILNLSWSADHRVVDGATMARMAERVRELVEDPGVMMARLR